MLSQWIDLRRTISVIAQNIHARVALILVNSSNALPVGSPADHSISEARPAPD